ncbi:hypothetical protein [Nonomuraea sp. NPDC049750]|uniref:WXG100-like domain-containing protein n=1 Tax=Nonomuraea sp. NPDC049750 TaxID=3154738 RepID=UPI0033E74EA2
MLLDGEIPGWMRPWIGWAVGMDWPEGDESKLFTLADALADAAYRVAEGSGVPVPDRDIWDGEALQAFVGNASLKVGESEANLLKRLAGMAMALNDLGVQVQYTKRLIKLSIAFLIFQLWTLVPVIANPATAGTGLAAAGWRARFTRAIVRQLAKRLLFNIGLFGGLMLAMDLGVQAGQERRDKIDWGQALTSLGTGALNGVFLTGATWLAPPRTLLGFMLASGAAGGMTDATLQAFDDEPFDLERLLKGVSSGAIGAADAHWASWNPHLGRSGGDGPPLPDTRGGPDPHGGPDPRGGSDTYGGRDPRGGPDTLPPDPRQPLDPRHSSDPRHAEPFSADRSDATDLAGWRHGAEDPALSGGLDPAGSRHDPVPRPGEAAAQRQQFLTRHFREETWSGLWFRNRESTDMSVTGDMRRRPPLPGHVDIGIRASSDGFLVGGFRRLPADVPPALRELVPGRGIHIDAADLASVLREDRRLTAQPDAALRMFGPHARHDALLLQDLADRTGRVVVAADNGMPYGTAQGYRGPLEGRWQRFEPQVTDAPRAEPRGRIESMLNWGQDRSAGNPPRPQSEFSQAAAKGTKGPWEPAGIDSARVTLSDGSLAMRIDFPTREARDAKVLVASLGEEFGLKMPSVHPIGDTRLLLEWVYGDPNHMSWIGEEWNLPGTVATRDGVLAGLLGALFKDDPVLLDALGGEAALMPRPAMAKLMSRLFIREVGTLPEGWAANPLSPADVVRIQRKVRMLGLDFADAGLAESHRRITASLRMIADNAVGTDSIFKVRPDETLPEITTRQLNDRAERLAELAADLRDTTPPGAGRPLVDPVQRLVDNLDDIVATRESDLGRVVTFGDGSQALALTGRAAADALESALARRALGLDGPAVHRASDGTVYQTHGSDRLRAALATGIRESDVVSLTGNRAEVVTFNDGTRALRHEFSTIAEADEFEGRAHAAHATMDGVQGVYRAAPTVVYEHRISPWHWNDETRAVPASLRHELNRRALHAWITPTDLSTTHSMGNPRMEHLVPGQALLTEADSAALRARFEALRPEYERYGLTDRYQKHLDLINQVAPDAPLDLGPLHDHSPLVPDFRETPWRPPGNQVPALPHLLEGVNLRQVNELAVGRADDPALVPSAEAMLDRADAELAARATTSGHVSARVPADWLPRAVRPGEEVVFHGLLEGVDDPGKLGDLPDSVRLTIRASEYADVEDLSGKPAHALFRSGVRLKVLAVQESFGERHLLAIQVPQGRSADSMALRLPRMKPPLTAELNHHLKRHVEETDAGVWLRDLDHPHDAGLASSARKVRRIDGALYVDGHGSERGNKIGDQTLDAAQVSDLLLNLPKLKPSDVILLANCDIGTGGHPLNVARRTGHVVIAADSAIIVTKEGHMRAVSPESGHLGGRGQFRIYLPSDPISGRTYDTINAWFQAP